MTHEACNAHEIVPSCAICVHSTCETREELFETYRRRETMTLDVLREACRNRARTCPEFRARRRMNDDL